MNHLDLFSGIGGFALAARWAGIQTVQFCEIDKYCQRVLNKNFNGVPIHDDIHTITVDTIGNAWYNSLTLPEQGVIEMAAHRKDYDGAVQMYNAGSSIGECAEYYHISRQAMWKILRRREVVFRENTLYGEENHFFRGTKADERAHDIVEKAVKRGALIPQPCEICGANGRFEDGRTEVQAHHDDYNFPMQVRWLCQKHHHAWHKHHVAIPHTKEVQNSEATEKHSADESILNSGIDIITGGFP